MQTNTAQRAAPETHAEAVSIGVEEEYQIVNPHDRELNPRQQRVLRRVHRQVEDEEAQPEFHLSQIETATPVCASVEEVRRELSRLRKAFLEAADRCGSNLAAAGTHPFSPPEEQPFTPKRRYWDMAANYQQLAKELVIFGCHIHVGVTDPEAAVQVMNRARVWLAPLLALTANSPFWLGGDTGYASFRTEMFTRWPMSGQPGVFDSRRDYDDLVQTLLDTGAIGDESNIYWDIRLPATKPTVEFRVTDTCLTIDEAVMLAGLVRGLAHTCLLHYREGRPAPATRVEALRPAHWRAARYGVSGELIDFQTNRSLPARKVVENLLEFIRPSLAALGDWDEVASLVDRVLREGNGADRQRAVYERTGSFEAVVDYVVDQTRIGAF